PSVRAEAKRGDHASLSPQENALLPRGDFPDLERSLEDDAVRAVETRRGQPPVGGAHGERRHSSALSPELLEKSPGTRLPACDATLGLVVKEAPSTRANQTAPRRAEGEGYERTFAAGEHSRRLALPQVPDPDCAIGVARGEPTRERIVGQRNDGCL